MIRCEIRNFVVTPHSERTACKAYFSVLLVMDNTPIAEIHRCVLLYAPKTESYYIGFPSYKRGSRYETLASILDAGLKAELTASAVRILGQQNR